MVACTLELYPKPVDVERFYGLHPDGKSLIRDWAHRGTEILAASDDANYFEGFIYLWFAFNGWGACVSGTDTDRQWVDSVAADQGLAENVAAILEKDSGFYDSISEFMEIWPIFQSKEIRAKGILALPGF